jgi:hypothetical protein
LQRPEEDGEGIQINEGDRLTIPAGAYRTSLDRSQATTIFSRYGISHYVWHTLYLSVQPTAPDDLRETLQQYVAECDALLENRLHLADLNAEATQATIKSHVGQLTLEGLAIALLFRVQAFEEALAQNDAKQAAWEMFYLVWTRAMFVFKRELEGLVWRGYSAGDAVSEVLEIWKNHRDDGKEGFWQKTLKRYSFVLSQVFAFPMVVIQERAYVGGTAIDGSGEGIADFLVANGLTDNVALIEIKTPKTKLLGAEYY